MMKAILYTQYGAPNVLQLEDIEKLVPDDDQVLIKVHSASVNTLDWHQLVGPIVIRLMNGALRKPNITSLGSDVAGWVEAVGKRVTKFKPGDAVFGTAQGSFAEYVCAFEDKVTLKPDNVSFEAAAAAPVAAFTALQALRDKGGIKSGQRVLINGTSGAVGTFAVQIAKSYGANVTAVCSTRNLEIARSIGADHLIDYTHEDFTKNGQQYDLILAVNGYNSIFDYRRALSAGGIYVAVGGALAQTLQALMIGGLLSKLGRQRFGFMGVAKTDLTDLIVIRDLLESGKVVPVIHRCYPLSKTAEALQYIGDGHAQGKVVISVQQ